MTKITIVMPAYNAAKTLEKTLASIPKELNAELLLVDDASTDGTADLAKRLGIRVVVHPENRGYGANQKSCYRQALSDGAGIVVMIHPDYQYDARMVPALIRPIELGICDVMLGNRIRTRAEALSGGMPLYKYAANRCLTFLENVVLGQNLGDFHSGMRAYSARVLKTIPWQTNSDDFLFDQQFLMQCAYFHMKMGDVPVPARYFREASSINFRRSVKYGFLTLLTLFLFLAARLGIFKGATFSAKPPA